MANLALGIGRKVPTGGGSRRAEGVGRLVGGATVGIPAVRKREVEGAEAKEMVSGEKSLLPHLPESPETSSSLLWTDVPQMCLKRNSNFQGFFSQRSIIQITANYWEGRQQSISL